MTTIQLWTKHRKLATGIAHDYFLPGSEQQDVVQECLIGLWIAAREYKPELGPFQPFAATVIHRRLADCVQAATRHKHQTLTLSVRETRNANGDKTSVTDRLPHLHQVSDRAEEHEDVRELLERIDQDLTPFERHCVIGIATGAGYLELGPYKRVDNALMRARRKLRAVA